MWAGVDWKVGQLSKVKCVMNTKQGIAFWELCRTGLPLLADAATESWERGKKFELGNDVSVPKSLKALLDQANWEVEKPSYSK
jgi:hypothetical protein